MIDQTTDTPNDKVIRIVAFTIVVIILCIAFGLIAIGVKLHHSKPLTNCNIIFLTCVSSLALLIIVYAIHIYATKKK